LAGVGDPEGSPVSLVPDSLTAVQITKQSALSGQPIIVFDSQSGLTDGLIFGLGSALTAGADRATINVPVEIEVFQSGSPFVLEIPVVLEIDLTTGQVTRNAESQQISVPAQDLGSGAFEVAITNLLTNDELNTLHEHGETFNSQFSAGNFSAVIEHDTPV